LESYDRYLAVSFEFLLPGFETSLSSRCRKYQAFRTFQKPSTLGNSQSTNMKLPGDRHLVSRTSSQTPLRGSTGIWQAGTAKLSNRNRGLFLAYISPDLVNITPPPKKVVQPGYGIYVRTAVPALSRYVLFGGVPSLGIGNQKSGGRVKNVSKCTVQREAGPLDFSA
jgi:hypothetical protein